MATATDYDAFISYSHQHDRAISTALQTRLERFIRPWGKRRVLKIFRDTSNLPAGPALRESIEKALQSSRWFILLTSPEAAESIWVNWEVQWWLDHKSAQRLLVVATTSGLAWDEKVNDWARSAPVPPALRGALASEPLWVDLSGVQPGRRGRLLPEDSIVSLAAPIRGIPKDTLARQHRRRRRRALQVAWATAAVLAGLSVALGLMTNSAVQAKDQAVQQLKIADSDSLLTQSEATMDTDPVRARQEAVAAWHLNPQSAQARYAMLNAAAFPGMGVLPGRPGTLTGDTFQPGRDILAVSTLDGKNGMVQLWDPTTRTRVGSPLVFPGNEVSLWAFSPDGTIMAIGQSNGIQLWDTATRHPIGRPLVDPASQNGSVSSLAFSPDGKILAVGTDSGAQLWSVKTEQPIGGPLVASPSDILSLTFSPDGRILATGGISNAQLWDVASGQPIGRPLPAGGNVHTLAFSPDGKSLAVGGTGPRNIDGAAQLWNVATQAQIGTTLLTGVQIDDAAFSPNGKILATGTYDGNDSTVQLWDVTTHQQISAPFPSLNSVTSLVFSPDGTMLAAGDTAGAIRLWDVASVASQPFWTKTNSSNSRLAAISFGPDGRTLSTASSSGIESIGRAQLWDAATRHPVRTALNIGRISSMAFSPDGQVMAIGHIGARGSVQLRDMLTGRPDGGPLNLPEGSEGVGSLAFSPDGTTLAASGAPRNVYLWDVPARKMTGTLTTAAGILITAMAFGPGGKTLAVGDMVTIPSGWVNEVQLWNLTTRKPIGGPLIPPNDTNADPITSIAFGPDSTMMATGSGLGAQLWDLATHQPIGAALPAGADDLKVYSVAFSPDGTILAAGGGNGTVQLWDVATGGQIGPPLTALGDPGEPSAVAFSRNGQTLAVSTAAGTTQLWNVAGLENVTQYLCAYAGRLTPAEWTQDVPGLPYENVCA